MCLLLHGKFWWRSVNQLLTAPCFSKELRGPLPDAVLTENKGEQEKTGSEATPPWYLAFYLTCLLLFSLLSSFSLPCLSLLPFLSSSPVVRLLSRRNVSLTANKAAFLFLPSSPPSSLIPLEAHRGVSSLFTFFQQSLRESAMAWPPGQSHPQFLFPASPPPALAVERPKLLCRWM